MVVTATLHVVLAEDHAQLGLLTERLILSLGHRVSRATTGPQAVELALAGDVDVVLMDVRLPELDGIEATRRIAARRNGKRPRIVGLTGVATADDRSRALEAGMVELREKPLFLEDLTELLAAS
jgi:CheY-like chemotaxis protein